jgi:hypothetical protein
LKNTFIILLSILFLGACTVTPPKNVSNICDIFFEKRDWYDTAADIRDKWGVPIHIPMSMMYQESSFKAKARPPKDYVIFGLIPCGSISTAYGYSQAKTPTWDDYKRETDNSWADRTDFDDAMDFMGWFISKPVIYSRVCTCTSRYGMGMAGIWVLRKPILFSGVCTPTSRT